MDWISWKKLTSFLTTISERRIRSDFSKLESTGFHKEGVRTNGKTEYSIDSHR